MHTQTQARAMWCPFTRTPDSEKPGEPVCAANRLYDGQVHGSHRCIASDCMAWRWATPSHQPRRAHVASTSDAPWDEINEPERPADLPASYTWSPPGFDAAGRWLEPEDEFKARRERDRVGFCGLAGHID